MYKRQGLADSIRLTNLIEAIPNYVKGETPVAFVGVSDNHFPRQDAYELTSDIAGIGDLYYWQGMYTAPFVLDSYVNQHLRANMLIFPQDAAIFTADTIADQLNDAGINASADEIKELLQDLHAFPKMCIRDRYGRPQQPVSHLFVCQQRFCLGRAAGI